MSDIKDPLHGLCSHQHSREATAIRAAAAELKPGYKPKLTFVICAKRVSSLAG